MFKLFELSIGWFAIVKSETESEKLPITVHGFIGVEFDEVEGYYSVVDEKLMSEELSRSGEIDSLREDAIFLTEEAVNDEYGD